MDAADSVPPGSSRVTPERVTTRLEIPGGTFARAAVAIVLTLCTIWLVWQVAAVLLMIAVAMLVSAVLAGLARPLNRHGVPWGLASFLSLLATVVVCGGVLLLVLPTLIEETLLLIHRLPELSAQLEVALAGNPAIFATIHEQATSLQSDPSQLVTGVFRFGLTFVGVVASVALILTLALYFMVDGDRVWRAMQRLTPVAYRDRVERTLAEAGRVVRAYFIGQMLISGIFATYTFLLLTILGLPYAGVLAAAAFLLDAIPNIGATIATILPALVALTESVTDTVIVVAAMLVYQQLENNALSPRILSGRLNVAPIATMVMVLLGGKVLGVVGVIIAIPLAGLLPIIEQVWIRPAPAGGAPHGGDTRGTGPDRTGSSGGEATAA